MQLENLKNYNFLAPSWGAISAAVTQLTACLEVTNTIWKGVRLLIMCGVLQHLLVLWKTLRRLWWFSVRLSRMKSTARALSHPQRGCFYYQMAGVTLGYRWQSLLRIQTHGSACRERHAWTTLCTQQQFSTFFLLHFVYFHYNLSKIKILAHIFTDIQREVELFRVSTSAWLFTWIDWMLCALA